METPVENLRMHILRNIGKKLLNWLKTIISILIQPTSQTLKKEFGFEVSYKTVWRWLKKSGLVKNPRRKRRRKHVYRNRLPQEGLLLQMDGCHHKFNGKDEWCLISAIDDATSHIPYAEFFSDRETTLNCTKVLSRIIDRKGVPKAIYTDRAGWAGGGKRTESSQFKRACEQLGIQLIFADTPEAKGRIERSFRTIQDRLLPELRLKGIEDIEKANEHLRSEFLENYWNKEKLVQPQDTTIAYSPLDPWLDLNQVLCVEESRGIGRDQTFSWQGKRYLIQDGNRPLCNYLAMFRTDLKGTTRVFVVEAEVEMNEVKDFRQHRKQRSVEDEVREQQKTPLGLSDDLYIKMYNLILDAGNAVKKHQGIRRSDIPVTFYGSCWQPLRFFTAFASKIKTTIFSTLCIYLCKFQRLTNLSPGIAV